MQTFCTFRISYGTLFSFICRTDKEFCACYTCALGRRTMKQPCVMSEWYAWLYLIYFNCSWVRCSWFSRMRLLWPSAHSHAFTVLLCHRNGAANRRRRQERLTIFCTETIWNRTHNFAWPKYDHLVPNKFLLMPFLYDSVQFISGAWHVVGTIQIFAAGFI